MSGVDLDKEEAKFFCAEYAKSGRSKCRHCGESIENETLRIGKTIVNPFVTSDKIILMSVWYHPNCMFQSLSKAGKTTKKKIEKTEDVEGNSPLSVFIYSIHYQSFCSGVSVLGFPVFFRFDIQNSLRIGFLVL